MAGINISGPDLEKFKQLSESLKKVNNQANKTQDVKADDLNEIVKSLTDMQSTYSTDTNATGKLARMIGDVQNLQGIASNTAGKSNNASNASWKGQMDDVSAMLDDLVANNNFTLQGGTGASVGTPVNAAEQSGDAKDAKGTLHKLPNGMLVADDKDSKVYTLFNSAGAKLSTIPYDAANKNAISSGTGQNIILSDAGFDGSWLTNDAAGRTLIDEKQTTPTGGTNKSSSAEGTALETITDTSGLKGELQNNKNPIRKLETKPVTYALENKDGVAIFGEDGKALTPVMDKNVPNFVGLGNGSWLNLQPGGLAKATIEKDVSKLTADAKTQVYTLGKGIDHGFTATAASEADKANLFSGTSKWSAKGKDKDGILESKHHHPEGMVKTRGGAEVRVEQAENKKSSWLALHDKEGKQLNILDGGKGINRGQNGAAFLPDGSMYVSNQNGMFTVDGDTVTNVADGTTQSKADFFSKSENKPPIDMIFATGDAASKESTKWINDFKAGNYDQTTRDAADKKTKDAEKAAKEPTLADEGSNLL